MNRVYLICCGIGLDQRVVYSMPNLPDAHELVGILNKQPHIDPFYVRENPVWHDLDMAVMRAGFMWRLVILTGSMLNNGVTVKEVLKVQVPQPDREWVMTDGTWVFQGCGLAMMDEHVVDVIVQRFRDRRKSPDFGKLGTQKRGGNYG